MSELVVRLDHTEKIPRAEILVGEAVELIQWLTAWRERQEDLEVQPPKPRRKPLVIT